MTGTELNKLINLKCGTNDTTFPVADKLVYVNMVKDRIASEIIDRDAGYFLVPSTFDLVADQREYFLGNDLLNRIQKLELKFKDTDDRMPSTWIKDYQGSEAEDQITAKFSNAEGEFAHTIRRRALLILSGTIIAVTNGARMWTYVYPENLANLSGATGLEVDPSTTTFGFPRQFHELWATGVAIEYKSNKPKPIPLNLKEQSFELDLENQLNALNPVDNSGEIIATGPSLSDTGNEGWDY